MGCGLRMVRESWGSGRGWVRPGWGVTVREDIALTLAQMVRSPLRTAAAGERGQAPVHIPQDKGSYRQRAGRGRGWKIRRADVTGRVILAEARPGWGASGSGRRNLIGRGY